MKKIFTQLNELKRITVFLVGSLFAYSISIQAQNVSASLGDGWFIEGVSPVYNTITFNDVSAQYTTVDFVAYDKNTNSVIMSNTNVTGSNNTFVWNNVDMGQMKPNTVIRVVDPNTSTVIDSIVLKVIPKPDWLNQGGTVSNVNVSGNTISIDASIPVYNFIQNVPYDVVAIGGKSYGVDAYIQTHIDFNMTNKTSTTNGDQVKMYLNVLQQKYKSFNLSFPSGSIQLDSSFNVVATISHSISTNPLDINFPRIEFPITLGISAFVSGGISLYGSLKGQVVVGQQSGNWGFIDNGGQKTKITAKLDGIGEIRGGISIVGGLVKAYGALDVHGVLGGGFEYVSVPNPPQVNSLFGGSIDVSGKIVGALGWGIFKETWGPQSFYSKSFGDISSIGRIKVSDLYDDIFNTKSITYKTNGTMIVPQNFPQPYFSTRGKNLYATWIEEYQNTGYLLFSKLDTNSSGLKFHDETVIISNENSISHPRVCILPSGKALITWTQSRYSSSTLPSNATIDDILESQDVWVALYDINTDTVYTASVSDDTSSPESGRKEGSPEISWGKGNNGLITWVSEDNTGSDIWYTSVTEGSNGVILSNPTKLADLFGTNKSVNVTFVDSTNAVAVWINDLDANDSTLNNEIVYSLWNGSNWISPSVLVNNSGNETFNDLSFSYNNGYAAIAWTSTIFDLTTGDFKNRLDIAIWDDNQSNWTGYYYVEDTLNYIQLPKVAINDNGIASISYQVVNMFSDTSNIDAGEIYLYLKDLKNSNSNWTLISHNPYICDTSAYVWELGTGFGYGNNFYILTQEYDKNGIVTSPKNGTLFGDPSLSLVLRGVLINNDLSLSDIPEPPAPVGIFNGIKNIEDEALENYPNPFNEFTTFEYKVLYGGHVRLDILDLTGRKIATLVNQKLSKGVYETRFESGDIQSGIYLYQLSIDGKVISTKKMIITK
jgi:hypothetical protein